MKQCLILLLAMAISGLTVKSQDVNSYFPEKDLVTTGIYYYPEHWNENQWERDIKKIADMGYEFVHLAEFAWFKMEPEEGRFDFAWLDKVVNLCAKCNLKVLMCTPSATTPTWMRINYPETFIMDGYYNPLLLPGTVRMWLYHSFAAGGKLACSYRFRQILYSSEQYHAGVILTDGVTPSPGGEDYIQFMKEIKELRKQYKQGAKMPEKLAARSTAILWNLENYWTIGRQKQTFQWDAWNYPVKFLEMTKSLGAPTDVIPETADFSKYKFLVVPAYELADSALVKKWTDYAANGGHLIITCRTATKDRNGHFWEGESAAPISGLIGAHIKATDMLSGYGKGDILMKSSHFNWNNWADLLDPDKITEVIATYNNQFYKGKAAVVKRKVGKGTVTYIGVDTDDSKLEKNILRDIYTNSGATTEDYPEGIYVYWRDGFYIAVNYSSDNYTMNLPVSAKILVGESVLKPAGVLVWNE